MNRSGAQANCWLLYLFYVCYLLTHIAGVALDGKIPLSALTGRTLDISSILLFALYQHVLLATHGQHFPRCLHHLTLLKIKFPWDDLWDPQKVTQQNRRSLPSSSGPEIL